MTRAWKREYPIFGFATLWQKKKVTIARGVTLMYIKQPLLQAYVAQRVLVG